MKVAKNHPFLFIFFELVIIVVAHIYPPATEQRQTLTYCTIRTLFIATAASWLEESAPAWEFPMIRSFQCS